MIVHVDHQVLTGPVLPKGNAGQIADALNGGALVGRTFTLKADGVVLVPSDKVPANANVLEVIEVPVTEPTPVVAPEPATVPTV